MANGNFPITMLQGSLSQEVMQTIDKIKDPLVQ